MDQLSKRKRESEVLCEVLYNYYGILFYPQSDIEVKSRQRAAKLSVTITIIPEYDI